MPLLSGTKFWKPPGSLDPCALLPMPPDEEPPHDCDLPHPMTVTSHSMALWTLGFWGAQWDIKLWKHLGMASLGTRHQLTKPLERTSCMKHTPAVLGRASCPLWLAAGMITKGRPSCSPHEAPDELTTSYLGGTLLFTDSNSAPSDLTLSGSYCPKEFATVFKEGTY